MLPRTAREARRLEIQSEMLREGTERLLSALPLRAGMSCLDVGCGTGDAMELIARHVGPSARVVGLDLDVTASRARIDRLRGAGAGSFDVIAGDLFGSPALPEATYDLTFSRYLMHHLADPTAAMARMWEYTRPGGILAVLDIDQRGTTTYPVWAPYEEDRAADRGALQEAGNRQPHRPQAAASVRARGHRRSRRDPGDRAPSARSRSSRSSCRSCSTWFATS